MTSRELNLCGAESRSYRARMLGRVAGAWLLCAAAMLAGASTASALPTAAIGGVTNPATLGALELSVLASETEDLGLESATALLDGSVVAEAQFEEGACRAGSEVACPAVLTLTVVTIDESDGIHELMVVVENEQGSRFTWTKNIEIDNTPPVSTPIVTVEIGSGAIQPGPPGPGPGPPSPTDRRCVAPRLSMSLAQIPLRYKRGRPVLAKGRKYRFTGRLTCRVDGRRRAAPRGTEVQVLHRTRRRLMRKKSLAVRRNGRVAARLGLRSRRVVIFRARGADGRFVTVRIKIRVAKLKRGRR
jgi:hypothetical protein